MPDTGSTYGFPAGSLAKEPQFIAARGSAPQYNRGFGLLLDPHLRPRRKPPMPDTVVELGKVDWKRIFPWVRLFRVFRTAIDLRMLTLACVALVALAGGDWLFTSLPFVPRAAALSREAYRWDRPAAENPLDLPAKVVHNPWGVLSQIGSRWERLLQPARTVLEPARTILHPEASWSEKGLAWTRLF